MKVSRLLVDCSVHSETPSYQRVGRELQGRTEFKYTLQVRKVVCENA